jgi:hypothetical protein
MPRGKHLLETVLARQYALFERSKLQRLQLTTQLFGFQLNALIFVTQSVGLFQQPTALRLISDRANRSQINQEYFKT